MSTFLQGMGLSILVGVLAVLLIFIVLLDVFEVVILPRRITRPLRLSVVIRSVSWWPWVMIARKIKDRNRRENFLGIYGPLGLLFLLLIWAIGIIIGFALLQWACGSAYNAPEHVPNFGTDLYVSGTNFFTLGHFFVSQRWGRRGTCAFFEMTRCCPLPKQRSVQCRRVAPSWFILYGRLR